MLGNQDDSSTTPVAVQEESNTVEQDMTDEQPDAYQHCNTSIYDSMSMSGDALDSSFTPLKMMIGRVKSVQVLLLKRRHCQFQVKCAGIE
jgi:hypothetical protein